ncbi:MAG: hypothetical protein M3Y86_00135 [Verrucomicrobiota bacterium]|nr:hypothetical protein [Verrucomicrobiota bacterium]
MKKAIACFFALIFSLLSLAATVSASEPSSVAGKYVGETNKETWCVLKEDGTLLFHEGGDEANGTYTADGDTISMVIEGHSLTTKLAGNALLPPGGSGEKLIKEDATSDATSDATAAPPASAPAVASVPSASTSGGSVAGKYLGGQKGDTICTLGSDGTIEFQAPGAHLKGTYTVDSTGITVTLDGEKLPIKQEGADLISPLDGARLFKQDGKAAPAAASVVGKYLDEEQGGTSCVLNADGTLLFHERGKDIAGTYKIESSNLITMNIGGDSVKMKMEGNALIPPFSGGKLIKQ